MENFADSNPTTGATFRVETMGKWGWEPVPESECASNAEGEELINSLRDLGGDWEGAEYRVVRVS